jgi:hypothetical protein
MQSSDPKPPRAAKGSLLSTTVLALALSGCGGSQSLAPEAPEAEPAAAPMEAPDEPARAEPVAAPETAEPIAEQPGSSPGPAPADPGLSDGETRTMKVIQKIIVDNREAFRACYDEVQEKVPELKGDMTLYFVLGTSGNIKEAALNEAKSTIKNDELTKCAIIELRKIDFPPSSKGLETKVNYPFNFNPR